MVGLVTMVGNDVMNRIGVRDFAGEGGPDHDALESGLSQEIGVKCSKQ